MSPILRILAPLFAAGIAHAAEPGPAPAAAPPQGKQAKVCATCHKTVEPGNLRGHFDEFAPKARSIQVKVDADYEVLAVDLAKLRIANGPEGSDAEKALQAVKKGAEVRVVYAVESGVKRATELVIKPKLQVSPDRLVTTAELEKLVAAGPEQARYALFDARPGPRFADGYIPTAESLPFPAFEKEKGKLPGDKNTLVIFYCSGVT